MSRGRPALEALRRRAGVLPGYVDAAGRARRTPEDTTVALLAALGLDARTERRAAETLAALREREAAWLVPPAGVILARRRAGASLTVRAPRGGRYRVLVTCEDGSERVREGRLGRGATRVGLPPLDWGYHVARVETRSGGGERHAESWLVVAPPACPSVAARLRGRRGWGLSANLYAVRSGRNWGAGDLTDLASLCAWAGELGAAFLAINPLHAIPNTDAQVSPYAPLSRVFRNPLYIDPEAVPELGESAAARAALSSGEHARELARLRAGERVEYARVIGLKRPILQVLHREFATRHRGRATARGRDYARYAASQGEGLTTFATFLAIAEHQATYDSRQWPAVLRDASGAAVTAFRDAQGDAVDFHRWTQFELERQLGAAADTARRAGLALGVVADLAIGAAPGGSDPWTWPALFASGASLGAPPDAYASRGQDWALLPLNPHAIAEDGYRYWAAVVRAALAHAGGMRLDHVMGLFRQFWVPEGAAPTEGGYVRFPARALLAVLALESARRGAVIVGEDLGTVPPGLPATLARWNVLSTRVLYFERQARGGFRPPRRYRRRALVTVNTHDHVPLAGLWSGRDLELRRAAGQLRDDRGFAVAARERERDRRDLLRLLARERVLTDRRPPGSAAELAGAVHTALARAPAPLVGVALDDLTGETEPVNLPGVGPDRYPSWTRRQQLAVERFADDAGVRIALGDLPRARRT